MKKTHGWILRNRDSDDKPFITNDGNMSGDIMQSRVYSTRREARRSIIRINSDSIRKVRIGSQGHAIRIIPGR